jgi:DNA repair exonuclease SbcCD ATPase subunit
MLIPTRLTVRGFRGFRGEETFEFPSPATIFSGENHCGKSSTLNALEWCLFGDQCKGKETNIRERVGWIIPNQHLERPEVLVELRLTDSDGEYVVRRRLHQPAKKRSAVEDLELECPDGDVVNGTAAEQLLARWLRSSFRDFSTTVYQHQESIRGIVTQEPRERNDAIDRLLGLSDYRNLLSGIAGADPKGRQKAIGKKFEAFEERVETAVSLVQQQLEQSRREAEEAGVPRTRLTEKTGLEIARQVKQ